jgi:hypothetical protein
MRAVTEWSGSGKIGDTVVQSTKIPQQVSPGVPSRSHIQFALLHWPGSGARD